ncbi:peptide ABC transporter substrate-binding protein [Aeromonas caviae]|uniref:Peptide ABC transporter substrate-binding protein n=1 Tax=Aeromonas caviae TaxID=648 RepID=A0ABD0B4V4_AERCA|nr:peptide ABC transporter substrate-binding protein [Aeromonas caviae]BCR29315.1 peptide ABC transporter substrate-binding protein [Aeromonas caviae]GJA80889.1 peptide ABC transporter substrate-binding protein [Aeromonas caviae]GJA97032.1 peptide ABC transporter substrate-binding protein [Aeromonas caviae]GJB11904.1 peptide ABC transporter substrate-binding protein [Aeromonas caviae]GJB25005.1 peptide ABC transporter substrate-binding protein [Aeromonas caviae]
MKKSLIAGAVAALLTLPVLAAQVPEGTQLLPATQQVFVRNIGTEPASIDPQMVEESAGSDVVNDLFEGLYTLDGNGKLQAAGALGYELDATGTVYTFKLRPDAKWSNGEPVTAADYVYGWQRAADPKNASNYAWFIELTGVANASDVVQGKQSPDALGIKALDDYTLQITLKNPVPFFLKTLSHYTTFPAPKATIEKFGHEWVKPANIVSNGAFALKEWTPNERLIAERNPHYWDNEHTVLNKVIYLEIVSDTAAYNRYRASELHYTTYPLEQYQQIKRQSPEELVSAPMLATYYYVFNTQRKPFDDVRVRKALSLAIDRDTITEKILGQGQLSAFSLTPPSVDGFELKRPASELMSKEERIKQAKALLGEAGYGPDKPLTVDILYNTNEGHKKIALAISSMWKHNLGVKAELNNMEWKTMVSALNEGDFGVSRYSWNGDYNDASTFLDIMTSSSSANSGKWFNKEYDALLTKAHDAKDPAERNRLYQQAEVLIDEEAPIAPVYFYVKSRLLKPNVKGYPYQNPQDLVYAKDLYLTAQ